MYLSFHGLLQDSFNGAKSWVKELQRRGDPNVVIALAGNKCDLESKRKVQTEEAQQYAKENEIIYMETSAKMATNIRNLFMEIGEWPKKNFLWDFSVFSFLAFFCITNNLLKIYGIHYSSVGVSCS